jgi:predicted RNase H-like nuclease (RuvC/YqgF family)
MPKVITLQHERKIAQMIRHWPDGHKLDWNAACIGAQVILGWESPPTRQALDKKMMIKVAYKTKKEQLKLEKQKLQGVSKPRSTLDAMKKITRLQTENDALKAELSKMAEMANRLIYNATLAGLSRERLMAPLPTIHEPQKKLNNG